MRAPARAYVRVCVAIISRKQTGTGRRSKLNLCTFTRELHLPRGRPTEQLTKSPVYNTTKLQMTCCFHSDTDLQSPLCMVHNWFMNTAGLLAGFHSQASCRAVADARKLDYSLSVAPRLQYGEQRTIVLTCGCWITIAIGKRKKCAQNKKEVVVWSQKKKKQNNNNKQKQQQQH